MVGASAGGFEAVSKLLSYIPRDIKASILSVIHLSSEVSGEGLLNHLQKQTSLECSLAKEGEKPEYGKVYIAPPNHHLLLRENEIKVSEVPGKINTVLLSINFSDLLQHPAGQAL